MGSERPLKVLHLTTHLNIGGITSYISQLGAAMVKKGHTVAVLSSGGELEPLLREKGLKVFRLPIRTKSVLHPKLFFALPKIIRLVKEERVDLLHAHTRVTQTLAFFVTLFTKVPYLSTAHGFYKRRLGRRFFPSWGKRVIAVSPLVAEELEKTHQVPRARIRIVFNAIDIPEYRKRLLEKNPSEIRRTFGLSENTFVIGSVSRLVRDKGHEFLIEAVCQLRKKHPDIFLLMIGDGRERRRLEAKIRRRKLNDHACLLSSTPDISGYLSIMDVFAHPATFKEGFGLAMLEAMVAKIPVVATNIWAINTIIRHGVNGYLVEPKNPVALEKTLGEVLANPEQAGSVAENAYQMAGQAYSIDRMANETETVYEETRRA
ncbi:MAG: glycosyltransferase family 4 protein [Candidatus Omnitrophica bacterium]|nr:glycosyltransferase family 4 protein [Candidatus Omnitrophota bacterium]